jgi:hypothetical protein
VKLWRFIGGPAGKGKPKPLFRLKSAAQSTAVVSAADPVDHLLDRR